MNVIKSILILIVIIVAAIMIIYGINFFNKPPVVSPTPTLSPQTRVIEGKISEIDVADKSIAVVKADGALSTVSISSQTNITDKNGGEVDLSYLRKGFTVRATVLVSGNTLNATQIKVLEEPNIIIFSPQSNYAVGLPLVIDGEARVFESTFNYRLKDSDGSVLIENSAMAAAPDAGQYGPFQISVNYPAPKGTTGTLEVFDYSAKDGSEIDKVIIPVRFSAVESQNVKVFFGNMILNSNAINCNKVFPVDRRISKTQAVARAALEELLGGTTAGEAGQGYVTGINSGVKINSLTVVNGVAKVDFDETLEQAVGGSCRVAEIRAEITQTLKQFPTVKSVIISINGRTADILQP